MTTEIERDDGVPPRRPDKPPTILVTAWMNDRVRFKPTVATQQRHRDHQRRGQENFPGHFLDPELKLDADGYHHTSLWQAMRLLAPDCRPGAAATEDGAIIVEVTASKIPG